MISSFMSSTFDSAHVKRARKTNENCARSTKIVRDRSKSFCTIGHIMTSTADCLTTTLVVPPKRRFDHFSPDDFADAIRDAIRRQRSDAPTWRRLGGRVLLWDVRVADDPDATMDAVRDAIRRVLGDPGGVLFDQDSGDGERKVTIDLWQAVERPQVVATTGKRRERRYDRRRRIHGDPRQRVA
jgi:hypothetical protein